MSRRYILWSSGIVSGLFLILDFIGTDKLCGGQEHTQCMQVTHSFLIIFLPFLSLFLLSLITYKMRDEVYRAWLRFAQVWIPLSMLLIFLAPEYTSDWMFPVVKGTVAFFSSILFLIISLLLIAWKYFTTHRNTV